MQTKDKQIMINIINNNNYEGLKRGILVRPISILEIKIDTENFFNNDIINEIKICFSV